MYTYIKSFAREKHISQLRKPGQSYIVQPLTTACDAVSMGIRNNTVVATILLHDVRKDCGVSVAELSFSDVVKRGGFHQGHYWSF